MEKLNCKYCENHCVKMAFTPMGNSVLNANPVGEGNCAITNTMRIVRELTVTLLPDSADLQSVLIATMNTTPTVI